MQSQFTDNAQEALRAASRCASSLKQGYVGTEHILVGLLKEQTGVAQKILTENSVELSKVMDMIRESIAFEGGVGIHERSGYSPRAQKVLEEAHRQAAGTWTEEDRNGAPSSCTDQRGRQCRGAPARHAGCQYSENLCGYADCDGTGRQSL